MSEIDWSKAPDGATHFVPKKYEWDAAVFWRMEGEKGVEAWAVTAGGLVHYREPVWTEDGFIGAIPRPTNQEWDGGLPDVGTVCEYQLEHDEPHDEWSRCVIEFVGDRHVVAKCWPDEAMPELEQCFTKREVKFRPLKSKKERQREELVNLISYHPIYKNAVVRLADDILSRYRLEEKR